MASYQLEEVPLGRIAPYAGAYKRRSSNIDIVPTDGILRKFKPDRSPAKALQAFDQGRSLFDPTAGPRLEDVLETARKRLELANLPWK